MKRAVLVVVAAILVMVSVPSANAVGLFGIWWDPDDVDSGYGLGVKQSVPIIPIVSIDGRLSWVNFSEGDASLDLFPIEAMGALSFGIIYAGFGVGYYVTSGDIDIDNSFGAFLVGGVKFTPAGIGVFGELKYNFVRPNFKDLDTELNMDGLGINVGVVFGG